jgi:hypothetical protein
MRKCLAGWKNQWNAVARLLSKMLWSQWGIDFNGKWMKPSISPLCHDTLCSMCRCCYQGSGGAVVSPKTWWALGLKFSSTWAVLVVDHQDGSGAAVVSPKTWWALGLKLSSTWAVLVRQPKPPVWYCQTNGDLKINIPLVIEGWGLDISQGTEANGRGALSDWPCALKYSFHIFHLPRPCPAEMASFSICQGHAQLKWPWKWVPYNFLMSSPVKGEHPSLLVMKRVVTSLKH